LVADQSGDVLDGLVESVGDSVDEFSLLNLIQGFVRRVVGKSVQIHIEFQTGRLNYVRKTCQYFFVGVDFVVEVEKVLV
jgi:hypothetical protein